MRGYVKWWLVSTRSWPLKEGGIGRGVKENLYFGVFSDLSVHLRKGYIA